MTTLTEKKQKIAKKASFHLEPKNNEDDRGKTLDTDSSGKDVSDLLSKEQIRCLALYQQDSPKLGYNVTALVAKDVDSDLDQEPDPCIMICEQCEKSQKKGPGGFLIGDMVCSAGIYKASDVRLEFFGKFTKFGERMKEVLNARVLELKAEVDPHNKCGFYPPVHSEF